MFFDQYLRPENGVSVGWQGVLAATPCLLGACIFKLSVFIYFYRLK